MSALGWAPGADSILRVPKHEFTRSHLSSGVKVNALGTVRGTK